jgi:hypothetical protein
VNANANHGRNIAFQLRLAADLSRAGAAADLDHEADICFNADGAHVYLECKRPFSENSVRRNVLDARSQLRRRFKQDEHPSAVGIVAISLSLVLHHGQRMLVVEDRRGLQEQLQAELRRVHTSNCSDLDDLADLRLLGIVYHALVPVWVNSEKQLYAATQSLGEFSGAACSMMLPVTRGRSIKRLIHEAFGPRTRDPL